MQWNLLLAIFCCLTTYLYTESLPAETVILSARPPILKQLYSHETSFKNKNIFPSELSDKVFSHHDSSIYRTSDKVFKIEPADAIGKFSQPAGRNPSFSSYDKLKTNMPWRSSSHESSTSQSLKTSALDTSQSDVNVTEHINKPKKDSRHLDSLSGLGSSRYPGDSQFQNDYQDDIYVKRELQIDNKDRSRNNFTDLNQSFISDSSSVVQDHESSLDVSNVLLDSVNIKQNSEFAFVTSFAASSPASINHMYNSSDSYLSTASSVMNDFSSEVLPSPKVIFDMHSIFNSTSQSNFTNNENFVFSTIPSSHHIKENVSESIHSLENNTGRKMSPGVVAGIVIGVLISITALSSAVIYLLYRRYRGKNTSVTDNKFNTDNCAYLDDTLRSSMYLNNHIELPKENSEEMTSLDNDSFLNSLETMTIQNYWAESSKNTKV